MKARAAAPATGAPAIADDSGIEAEALGGAPGVRSARYAGPDATDAENLDRCAPRRRPGSGLRYVCARRLRRRRGEERGSFEGRCEGRMAEAPRGERRLRLRPASSCPTTATAAARWPSSPTPRRTAISHRGRAAREAAAWLAGE